MYPLSLNCASSFFCRKPPLFTSVGHNYRLRFAGEQHLDCRHNSNRGFRIARSLIQEKEPELEIVKVEEEATDIMKSHRRKSSQMMIGGVKVSPELFAIAMGTGSNVVFLIELRFVVSIKVMGIRTLPGIHKLKGSQRRGFCWPYC